MGVTNFISRRKIIFPFFLILLVIIAGVLVYMFSLSQELLVSDASLSVSGENVLIKMTIENTTEHVVNSPEVVIVYGAEKLSYKLKAVDNKLIPKEKYDFLASIPLSESTVYEVFLTSPFTRPIKYTFNLDPATIEPVKAVVTIASKMVVGKKYDVSVRLCNVSNSDLYSVEWIDSANGNYFKESFVPRQIPLHVNECKNLYSSLTPQTSGEALLSFTLKVGDIIKSYSHEVSISQE